MAASESLYTVEEVLDLLEDEPDDDQDPEDVFFPGSDDELGIVEEVLSEDEDDSDNEVDSGHDGEGTENELDQGGEVRYK